MLIFFFIWYLLIGLSAYKLFEKAKEPGWKGAVPFYNLYTWIELSGRPKWWLALLIVPILNVFVFAQMIMDMLKQFDRTAFHDYVLGLILTPLYFTYVAFDPKAEWNAPAAELPKIAKGKLRDWTDSILFAVVAATLIRWFLIEAFTIPTPSMENSLLVGDFLFVSKVNYGPRIPETPLSFPFAHNTMPMSNGSRKSYLEWIKLPYYRLPGFEDVERNDVVVFNFPADLSRPTDKKDNYIKRCVALPGDEVRIVKDELFVNGEEQAWPEHVEFRYEVDVERYMLSKEELTRCGISLYDFDMNPIGQGPNGDFKYILHMEPASVKKLKELSKVKQVKMVESNDPNMFMNFGGFDMGWNVHDFGPLWIPKKGEKVAMNDTTFHLYKECISTYEQAGDLRLRSDGSVEIRRPGANWETIESYEFTMDYYWMMGDNRHNSLDSRMWGFVPENHIVGKALFVWFSFDKFQESFGARLRLKRMLKGIH